jgi:hypothetical protein
MLLSVYMISSSDTISLSLTPPERRLSKYQKVHKYLTR